MILRSTATTMGLLRHNGRVDKKVLLQGANATIIVARVCYEMLVLPTRGGVLRQGTLF